MDNTMGRVDTMELGRTLLMLGRTMDMLDKSLVHNFQKEVEQIQKIIHQCRSFVLDKNPKGQMANKLKE